MRDFLQQRKYYEVLPFVKGELEPALVRLKWLMNGHIKVTLVMLNLAYCKGERSGPGGILFIMVFGIHGM